LSTSTGLYPTLDLQNANKLQLHLQLLRCDAALQYRIAGQAGALVIVWCQLLTVQVGTEFKTQQSLTGKRQWRN
jgi:hypothetical protein